MSALTQIGAILAPAHSYSLSAATVVPHSGRAAVLSCASQLEDLAERSGQPGAMHGLLYLLDHEYASRKLPHLVLFFTEHHDDTRLLVGSVLLFEYRIGSWRTGIIATGDSFGVRTVIGPEPLRASIAAAACSAMLGRHARIVLASFKQSRDLHATLFAAKDLAPHALWTIDTRQVQDHLPLAATYEATLATMGKRTRTHLRYYRRRLEESVACDFLLDVSRLIDPDDAPLLRQLNRSSLDPISQEGFDLQYRSAALLPDGFVCGLRSKDGHWLSLAGGWRQGDTTWVQWQMNASGFESFSLSTVLRSFLIEAEVARGARKLAFHGGTSHSMGHAFAVEQVVDLVARRPGFSAALIARVLPRLYARLPSLRSRGNFLADALRNGSLHWHSTASLPEEFRKRVFPTACRPSWPPGIG